MTTATRLTEREAEQRDALADRIHDDCRSAMELYCVYLGDRLGLYRALADRDDVTSSPAPPGSIPGMRANGSSNRPSPGSWRSRTAGSGSRAATRRRWPIGTPKPSRRRSPAARWRSRSPYPR
jgi:hypothetical protein